MSNLAITRPTSPTFAVALGAAMITGHVQYPPRLDPYEVKLERGTHSDFIESLTKPAGVDHFAQQVAALYNGFAESQQRLGAEFEAAIFSDLESLYEA